jgi:hypothetical protein
MLDLWWKKSDCDVFLAKCLGFPLSVIIPPLLHTHIHPAAIDAFVLAVGSALKWNASDMVLWTVAAALGSRSWFHAREEKYLQDACLTAEVILCNMADNF